MTTPRRYGLRAPCRPSSLFYVEKEFDHQRGEEEAVAAPPVGINGGVKRLWLAISKVLSARHLPLTPLTLHATQRRAWRGAGQVERS